MRARVLLVVLLLVGCAWLTPAVALGWGESNAAECGSVSVAGHVYLVVTSAYSCTGARTYVRKLAAEKPIGAATGLSVGKLTRGPAGYSCGASGWPQRIGRCFKGALGFTWVKQR